MRVYKETFVDQCHSCPFFSVESMEYMMLCTHPFWNGKKPYAGAIITQTNRESIPGKCPLRNGPQESTTVVRLA